MYKHSKYKSVKIAILYLCLVLFPLVFPATCLETLWEQHQICHFSVTLINQNQCKKQLSFCAQLAGAGVKTDQGWLDSKLCLSNDHPTGPVVMDIVSSFQLLYGKVYFFFSNLFYVLYFVYNYMERLKKLKVVIIIVVKLG